MANTKEQTDIRRTSSRDGYWTRLPLKIKNLLSIRTILVWFLLLWALGTIVYGLADIVQGLDKVFALLVMLVAMILSGILGGLPMRSRLAGALSGVLGVEFLLLRVGRLEGELLAIGRALLDLLWQIVIWRWVGPPDVSTFVSTLAEFWMSTGTLMNRVITWGVGVFSESAVFDPVGTTWAWGLGVWFLGCWGGWALRRKEDPLLSVLPGGIILTFVIAYVGARSRVLIPLLTSTLLLMGLLRYQSQEFRWKFKGIDFSQDLWSDVIVIVSAVTIALVLIASIAPSISIKEIVEFVQELTEREEPTERVAKSFGLEQQPQPREVTPIERVTSTGLPRRHLINSGPELSRIVALVIKTGELPEIPNEVLLDEVPQHYWRSLVYDRYFGRGWSTTPVEKTRYAPGELVTSSEVTNTKTIRQEVQHISNQDGIIHVTGKLISVDKDFEVNWRPPKDVFGATLDEVVTYRADSIVPVVSETDLRTDEGEYPEWILERYLQLPEELPERVLTLARDLTATAPTPYDRALVIETYLRQFPYNLNVPFPPIGQDIADFFLFDLQEGYCDYYATAMVVLARAAGLPSRLVVGYATGDYDPINARYIVTEADAHAWPEIYFPSYGWVEFEPTAAYLPIGREMEDEPVIWPEGDPLAPLVTPEPTPSVVWWPWVLGGIALFFIIILVSTGVDSLILLLWGTPKDQVTRLYHRLQRHARGLRIILQDGDTPNELGRYLSKRLHDIALERQSMDILDPAIEESQQIVDSYIQAWYTPRPISQESRKALVWAWWKLRWRLLLARLWRKPPRAQRTAGAADGIPPSGITPASPAP